MHDNLDIHELKIRLHSDLKLSMHAAYILAQFLYEEEGKRKKSYQYDWLALHRNFREYKCREEFLHDYNMTLTSEHLTYDTLRDMPARQLKVIVQDRKFLSVFLIDKEILYPHETIVTAECEWDRGLVCL